MPFIGYISSVGKEKMHVVRYLLGVSIATGKIVFLYGPFQGASNDLTLINASGFCSLRLPGEWTLGDAIFKCKLFIVLLFNSSRLTELSHTTN